MALGPLKLKAKINTPMNGAPSIQIGIKEFILDFLLPRG
jgi:hypothetical protein